MDQPASTNENVGSGVGYSVVNDLMRVYENLTQSSTPQARVPDASKALSIAYNTNNNGNSNSNVPAPPAAAPLYPPQPPMGYPIPPPPGYQQQQHQIASATTTARAPKNPLHTLSKAPSQAHPTSDNNQEGDGPPNAASYPQQQQQRQGTSAYAPAPMGEAQPGSPPQSGNKDGGSHHSAQPPGEETHHGNHNIVRSSSIISNQQQTADASSESDKSGSGGRSRRKRKQQQEGVNSSGGGKKGTRNKKSKKEDGRWSKRFTWPEDLHRDFVSAIFDVGLKHSSPSAIMEHMPKHEQITTERIKSHLQKYRLHRVKSKKEFISSYEASLRNFQQNQSNVSTLVSGSGEVAAHLTSTALGTNKNGSSGTVSKEGADHSNGALAVVHSGDRPKNISQPIDDGNDSLMLPQLTEEEKQSPIGAAMGYLMGLFFSLKQQLVIQRSLEASGEKAKGNTMFSSSPVAIAPGSTNIIPAAATATAAAVAAGVEFAANGTMQQSQQLSAPVSIRSKMEENSMMKREMKNQMALQNKMRALKQQELAKYNNINNQEAVPDPVMNTAAQHGGSTDPHFSETGGGIDRSSNSMLGVHTVRVEQKQHQPIGGNNSNAVVATQSEMAGTDMSSGQAYSNNNDTSMLDAEDFWHTDVVDEQLFEFLMNN